MTKIKQLLIALSLSLASASAFADVSGDWVFAVTLGDLGSGNATISLSQEAEGKLTGTYGGQLANGPVAGTHDGNNFEFSFSSEAIGGSITYSGMLKEDGTVEGAVLSQGQEMGTFTGKKS